jgi:hypothetical protein
MADDPKGADDMRAQTKGFGPIVLRRGGRDGGGHQHLRMHADLKAAHEEAKRLARKEGGFFCVYAPIIVVQPADAPPTSTVFVNLDEYFNHLAAGGLTLR